MPNISGMLRPGIKLGPPEEWSRGWLAQVRSISYSSAMLLSMLHWAIRKHSSCSMLIWRPCRQPSLRICFMSVYAKYSSGRSWWGKDWGNGFILYTCRLSHFLHRNKWDSTCQTCWYGVSCLGLALLVVSNVSRWSSVNTNPLGLLS